MSTWMHMGVEAGACVFVCVYVCEGGRDLDVCVDVHVCGNRGLCIYVGVYVCAGRCMCLCVSVPECGGSDVCGSRALWKAHHNPSPASLPSHSAFPPVSRGHCIWGLMFL